MAPTMTPQTTTPETLQGTGIHNRNRRKSLLQPIGTELDNNCKKIKQQFGFTADPNKTLLHNASSALAHTPTWYYFSRPSHLVFHDFTQQKNLMFTFGPWTQVYSNSSLYQYMEKTQKNIRA